MTDWKPCDDGLYHIFHLMRVARRHYIIELLAAADDAEKSDRWLAREISAIENGIDPAQVSSDEYNSVYISLMQTHLPSLDNADIIEYDRQKTVSTGPNFILALLLVRHAKSTYRTLQQNFSTGSLKSRRLSGD